MQKEGAAVPPDFANQLVSLAVKSGGPPLRQRLGDLAGLFRSLPDVEGAMAVALDEEGFPITSGRSGLATPVGRTEIETLLQIRGRLRECESPGDSWCELSELELNLTPGLRIMGTMLGSRTRPEALLIVSLKDELREATAKLLQLGSIFSLVPSLVQHWREIERWRLADQLTFLVQNTIASIPYGLDGAAIRLGEIFEADAVSLFLEEHGELHLAASTDAKLSQGSPIVYLSGQGLTGNIFKRGKPIRLTNTADPQEVKRVAGIERAGPLYPEHDFSGHRTVQYLGVPMRHQNKVVGVLRMSRRRGERRFIRDEEEALQSFADLLGAALAHYWQLLLARSILESSSEAVLVSCRKVSHVGGAVPRVVIATAGASRVLRRAESDIVGRDARDLYAPGEYGQIRAKLRAAISQATEDALGEIDPISSRIVGGDGTFIPVEISYRVLTNPLVCPHSLYTIAVARDVSESARQREQLNRFFELLAELRIVYFRANAAGVTEDPNPVESEITGYSLEELATLQRDRLYPTSRERTRLLDRARKEGGHLSWVLQRLQKKNDDPLWAEGDLRILKGPDGQETGIEGFYRDVTERIQLQGFVDADTTRALSDEELFQRLRANAQFHLNYEMSLAHQLLTPLTSLVENLRNIEQGVIDGQAVLDRLPYVIGQTLVCMRLVRNLSFMDKILRGEDFRSELVPLFKLAVETKGDFEHLLEERNLRLRIRSDRTLRRFKFWGHREMLRQVFVNLVDNGIKYSRSGTQILFRAREGSEGLTLEICNRGLRVPEHLRNKIFDRGYRSPQAMAVVPHGTGLGLWLVRKILEAHRCSIRCVEIMEGGRRYTAFRIVLPHSRPVRGRLP